MRMQPVGRHSARLARFQNGASLFAAAVIVCFVASTTFAQFVPDGLMPGDAYQLIFITGGNHSAVSSDIAVYNAFVQSQATGSPGRTGTDSGVNYFAIGSTATVDARDNAIVNAPIYNMIGQPVADGRADFWDGRIDSFVRYTQGGSSRSSSVWTGSWPTGTGAGIGRNLVLGAPSRIEYGINNELDLEWMSNGNFVNNGGVLPFYALSDVITVPITCDFDGTGTCDVDDLNLMLAEGPLATSGL